VDVILPLGYPADEPKEKLRKSLDAVRTYWSPPNQDR